VRESEKVSKYINRRTQTASLENNVQTLVRKAYAATVADLHGQIDPQWALGLRRAVEIVTGGHILAVDMWQAVCWDQGL
jgi:hypothetical protein